MAPRTRSNRVEMLARGKLLASGQPLNTTGFAALPDELYLEIISHFPAYPITLGYKSVNIQAVRDRHVTLLALSQVCRSLRPAFLRYLWQRIEVYDGMETGKGQLYRRYGRAGVPADKRYAEELVRQLEVVTVREPSLARHVNFINVFVTGYSADTVLAELARCIALFPNLHTVQLNFRLAGANYKYRTRVDNPFKTYRYPSIKNAYVCPVSDMILKACPEARIVSLWRWNESSWSSHSIFECAVRYCPALEVLGTFLCEKGDVETIAEELPKLREVSLAPSLVRSGFEGISTLSKLRYLRTINIIIRPYHGSYSKLVINNVTLTEWVQWAKDILSQGIQKCEDDQEPRKVVVHHEKRKHIHVVNFHKNR